MLFPGDYALWVKRRSEIARPLLWSQAKYVILHSEARA